MRQSEINVYLKAMDRDAELSDREVLAILLDGTSMQLSGYEAADVLIEKYGSLADITQVSSRELAKTVGIGPEGARLIKACRAAMFNMIRSNCTDDLPRMFTKDEVVSYFKPLFVGQNRELLYVCILNDRYKLLYSEEMGIGDSTTTVFNLTRVVELLVKYHGTGVIVAHNHTVTPYPSTQDVYFSNKISEGLSLLGYKFLDHLVFFENEVKSLRDDGHLKLHRKRDPLTPYPDMK